MSKIKNSSIDWNFNNSYVLLPPILMTKIKPTKCENPKIAIFNDNLSKELNLNISEVDKNELSLIFSGNKLPSGSECIAQAYAGHQFGHFTMLGDGRAILLGEHINDQNKRFDIQFKGSGTTPYSRNGDGRASIESMLREFLMSESMYNLNIPTTRSLAIVNSGEKIMRDREHESAILTRVASSHIRVGTFQYLSMKEDFETLEKLINYTHQRHYKLIVDNDNNAINLLNGVIDNQINLIIEWMRVGFIHGVMNTDNMSISGETIDYGPCAFMDDYNPNKVFSSIDYNGRYSYKNQEIICHWNLSRFAETLIPFLAKKEIDALTIGKEIIDQFRVKFDLKWLSMMKSKFGFLGNQKGDLVIIKKFLNWMEINESDFTNTFVYLTNSNFINDDIYKSDSFKILYDQWKNRINKNPVSNEISNNLMKSRNPIIIPRNHLVEDAINEGGNNYKKIFNLLDLLKNTYDYSSIPNKYFMKPPSRNFKKNYKTYCGT